MDGTMRREVLVLVALVMLVDAIFLAVYFLARVHASSPGEKLVFTAGWTLVALAVVIRGLSRVRSARLNRGESKLV
jgi:hypothetical protein